MNLNRSELGLSIQILSGHNRLNYQESKIDTSVNSSCRFCEEEDETKVGLLSGAVTIVSVISGPSIFCSVLWNFQAVSWEQGADRSIKVTTLSKQICIKNKINLSSVNWKFKRRSGTSFILSQWIKLKICPLQLKLLLKQIKTVQKLFHILP